MGAATQGDKKQSSTRNATGGGGRSPGCRPVTPLTGNTQEQSSFC